MRSLFFRQSEFPHRMNKDGTIDSICPRCYATIGTSTREADLKRMEAAHVCEPSRLSHFEELRRRPIVREEPASGQDHDVALPSAPFHGRSERAFRMEFCFRPAGQGENLSRGAARVTMHIAG